MVICLMVAAGCGSSSRASGSLVVHVVAGPTCPVERIGDPSCAPRAVPRARLQLAGPETLTLVADSAGWARTRSPIRAGTYQLSPQPVTGLVGTAPPSHVLIVTGSTTRVTVIYDTGIR